MIGLVDARADARRLALALTGRMLGAPGSGGSVRRRILVVRPDHLGDLLVLTPALSRLRQAFPDAHIVGLVGPWGAPVLERNPHLDRLITWEFPWFDRRPRTSLVAPYWSLLHLARRLRPERFDLALQFRADFWWGALAVRLAGVPEHLGFDVPTLRPFLTRAIPLVHGFHAAEENLRLVEAVAGSDLTPGDPGNGPPGLDPPPAGEGDTFQDPPALAPALQFVLSDADRRRARELLGPADGRPFVALQVGAGAPVKLWPAERLSEVGRALGERFGTRVVVIGGRAEADLVNAVAEGIGGDVVRLAGATTLGELGAVLARCALAVGPDSGPLHLAVAVGTPTVHLFGPADPRRFGPYGDAAWHRVVQSRWPCCPCDRLDFSAADRTRHDCVARIAAAEVIQVASDLLGRSIARAALDRR